MADTVQFHALRRAAELCGVAELAKRLNVPEDTLQHWLSGHATMPPRKFIVVLDLLSDAGATPG